MTTMATVLLMVTGFLMYTAKTKIDMGHENGKLSEKLIAFGNVKSTAAKTVSIYAQLLAGEGKNGIELLEKIKQTKTLFTTQKDKLLEVTSPDKQSEVLEISTIYESLNKTGEEMAFAYISEDKETGATKGNEFKKLSQQMEEHIEKSTETVSAFVKNATLMGIHEAEKAWKIAMFVMIFCVISAVIMIKFLLNSVRSVLANQARELNEEKENLEKRLTNIVSRLGTNYSKLQETVSDLDDSSSNLSMSSTKQASATEEAVAAMEEIASMVKQTSENGNYSLEVAKECQDKVHEGQRVVGSLDMAMNEINKSNSELKTIVNLIDEISAKTNVINSIVVKTELLSFNASIEAARAAEYGKGFAVVAEEVGNLARLSGESAKEIEALLDESSKKVDEIVGKIQTRVHTGQERSSECVNVFGKINELSSGLTNVVNSISIACNEQTKGVDQTTEAMSDISRATQDNLKITNDTSGLSNLVKKEIDDLSQTIMDLQSLIDETEKAKSFTGDSSNHNSHPSNHGQVLKFESSRNQKRKDDTLDISAIAQNFKQAASSGVVPSADDDRFE